MTVSIAQLNMLSVYFGFDIAEARKLLGLPIAKCPDKQSHSEPPKQTRRTGYNLYCENSKERIEQTLKSQCGGAKLPRGQLQSEMSMRWKKLPEAARQLGKQRACNA